MKKNIPTFNSEAEERKFWQDNDSSDYVDWSEAEEAIFFKFKAFDSKNLHPAARIYD